MPHERSAAGEAAAPPTQVGDPSAGSGRACATGNGERPAGIRLGRMPALQKGNGRRAWERPPYIRGWPSLREGSDLGMDPSASVGMTGGDGGLGAWRYVLRSLGCARDDRSGLGAWR